MSDQTNTSNLFKVIGIDNADREYISDRRMELLENLSESDATLKAEELNNKSSDWSRWYYVVKPQDYKLYDAYEYLP